jgi:hypothetical protein
MRLLSPRALVWLSVPVLALAAGCESSDAPEKGDDTAAEDDGTSGGDGTDSGLTSGGGTGSDGSDGTDPGLTDNDGDGWATEQGDLDDGDATVHPGALEVLGDGIDQDCDGEIDEVHLDRVPELDTCQDARDVRLAANSSAVFASVLCTQARVSMPDEDGNPPDAPTDYWDSALAFGWTAAQPAGPPTLFYDWSRNLSDPNSELLTGQGLIATDDALFGAVALRTPSVERASLRLAGFEFADGGRFGINFSGRDALSISEISLASSPSGTLHAVACNAEHGAPRTLLGSAATLYDSSYDVGGELTALGSTDTCAVYYRDDGTGVVVGGEGGRYEWASFPDPGALVPEDLSLNQVEGVSPLGMRVVQRGSHVALLIADDITNSMLVEEVGADPSSATRHTRMRRSTVFSGSLSADGETLALAWVDDAGDPQVEVGPLSGGGATTYSPDMPPGTVDIQSFEVHLSDDGQVLHFAAADGNALYLGAVGL